MCPLQATPGMLLSSLLLSGGLAALTHEQVSVLELMG